MMTSKQRKVRFLTIKTAENRSRYTSRNVPLIRFLLTRVHAIRRIQPEGRSSEGKEGIRDTGEISAPLAVTARKTEGARRRAPERSLRGASIRAPGPTGGSRRGLPGLSPPRSACV